MSVKPYARSGMVIRRRREGRGWSVAKLAAAIGVSRTYLHNIEAGLSRVPPEHFRRVCAELIISPESFAEAIADDGAEIARERALSDYSTVPL